jgi:hypothetical protein
MTIWCWVRDTATGHRYDIPLDRLDALEARGAVVEIPGRRRDAIQPRRPKHFVRLAELARDTGRRAGAGRSRRS